MFDGWKRWNDMKPWIVSRLISPLVFRGRCEEPFLGLNRSAEETDRRRILLEDEHQSGYDRPLVPSFPRLCSGMFPERLRTVSVLVVPRENRLVLTEHLKCGSLSCWNPGTIFSDLAFYLLRELGHVVPTDFRDGLFSWLAVVRMFLFWFLLQRLPISSYFSMLPFFERNTLSSGENSTIFCQPTCEYNRNVILQKKTNSCNVYSQLRITILF